MNSNESTDLKDKENELALEQAKMERIKMELELEKMKQESAPLDRNNVRDDAVEPTPQAIPPKLLLLCLLLLPPIGIIWVWRLKAVDPLIKIICTLVGLISLIMLMGWISLNHEPWHMFFLFTGQ